MGIKSLRNFWKASVFTAMLYIAVSLAHAAEWEGTIWPSKAPDWVKERFKEIAEESKGYKKYVHMWPRVGVPDGLEEQVWKAWAPGAPRIWENISPGFTNVIVDAKIDNGIITVILDLAGLIQSRDGGQTWRHISHHMPRVRTLSFDISPIDPNLIVAGAGYLALTRNGGQSWSFVYDKALPEFSNKRNTPFNQVRFNADGSRLFATHGKTTNWNPNYATIMEKKEKLKESIKRKLIYVADGNAKKFIKIDLGEYAAGRCLVPHPTNPDIVFVSFSDGTIYRSTNASQAKPEFVKLKLPEEFNGLQCFRLDISPVNPDELLLVMVAGNKIAKLFHVTLDEAVVNAEEIHLDNSHGRIHEAKWNPHNSKQVFVGVDSRPSMIYVSNDGMKTFQMLPPFPEKLKCGETSFYWSPCRFTFDRKSNLAMVRSLVGAWTSRDGFKDMTALMMDYDPKTGLYGNKGVGVGECVDSISISDKYTYITITDHGAFRSNGKDITKWERISWNKPGLPIVKGKPFRGQSAIVGVSDDEKYVYQVLRKPYRLNNLRIMQSQDQGDTWTDITTRFGKGNEISINQSVQQIMFDPNDSNKQWFLFREILFYSLDGGKTFKEVKFDKKALLTAGSKALAYDPVHKILYLSQIGRILRSSDFGATWAPLSIKPCTNVGGVGVLDNGDLVLGMMGALVVIPYDKIVSGKIEPKMVRMTLGEKPEDFAVSRFDFRGVCCKGQNIIVSTLISAGGNSARRLGILMSTDGGKSFKWISHDIPYNGIGCIDMKGDSIVIGARTLFCTTLDKCLKGLKSTQGNSENKK